ncbi:hypothetical protein SAMN02799630_02603 [Paenibacillus sp. UNCCL117]|uniref:hypothetical protein n=1 Tax=unclassified Paenibacillus TaxID=185978 RepID=UPI00087E2E64|nr:MULTISPECIES: hypothetical protein [unclassified Paenibacillus]SDC07502.1 hypothetical protein SAMN04488602_101272 [Paenibacillus sp. cl123]SFW38060.1 hypothetical protein SAMN02799630_02603 [Paenibacillus sp. UNCCL117]
MNKVLGILGVLLPFLSIIWMKETSMGFIVGDYLLGLLGIPAWSRGGESGLHWSAISGLVLLLLGWLEARRYGRTVRSRRWWTRYNVVLVLFFMTYSTLAGKLPYVWMAGAQGVEAIGYSPKGSECSYKSEPPQEQVVIVMTCSYRLVNYSGKPVTFLLSPDVNRRLGGGMNLHGIIRPVEFEPFRHTMEPRAEMSFTTSFRSGPVGSYSGEGSFNQVRFLLSSEGITRQL